MQTPHRFRSKRQLWTTAVWQWRRTTARNIDMWMDNCNARKSHSRFRGLNQNHNHAMKEIFKGAALNAALRAGPFQDFYEGLLAREMKPELARVTTGAQDRGHYANALEEGRVFRRWICEATSSLSVKRKIKAIAQVSWPMVAFRFSRRSGSR